MATENATPSAAAGGPELLARTRETGFFTIPADEGRRQFCVAAGGDWLFALSTAGALEEAVQLELDAAVQSGMPSHLAYLCNFALQAAEALRHSVGAAA